MPVDQIQDALRAQIEGVHVGVVADGQKRVPIVIRGDETLRADPARFTDLQLHTPAGIVARVSDMARIERTEGPVKLDHENGSRFALVRSEEHTSELQSLMRISYAVFCLTKTKYSIK